jgi:hypothetical protein
MQNSELNILIVDDDREDIEIAEGVLPDGLQGVPVELASAYAVDRSAAEILCPHLTGSFWASCVCVPLMAYPLA